MKRYAILREADGDRLPMALVVERDEDVTIVAWDEYGLPRKVHEPYRVLQRDLTSVEYRPGDEGYFDQVLVELQRLASIGSVGEIETADRESIIKLYDREVLRPRISKPQPYVAQAVTAKWFPVEEDAAPGVEASDFSEADLRVAA